MFKNVWGKKGTVLNRLFYVLSSRKEKDKSKLHFKCKIKPKAISHVHVAQRPDVICSSIGIHCIFGKLTVRGRRLY